MWQDYAILAVILVIVVGSITFVIISGLYGPMK